MAFHRTQMRDFSVMTSVLLIVHHLVIDLILVHNSYLGFIILIHPIIQPGWNLLLIGSYLILLQLSKIRGYIIPPRFQNLGLYSYPFFTVFTSITFFFGIELRFACTSLIQLGLCCQFWNNPTILVVIYYWFIIHCVKVFILLHFS